MRLDSAGHASRRLLWTTAFAVTGTAAASFFAYGPLSALRASFEARVSVSVGSKLNVFHAQFKLAQDVRQTIEAPRVARVVVRRVESIKVTAVVAREFSAVLKRRPIEAATQAAPAIFVDRSNSEAIDESQMNRKELVAVLMGAWQEPVVHPASTQKLAQRRRALKKVTHIVAARPLPVKNESTQPKIQKGEPSALELLANVHIEAEPVPAPSEVVVKWQHTQPELETPPVKENTLEYSQLVELMQAKQAGTRVAENTPTTQVDAAPIIQVNTQESPADSGYVSYVGTQAPVQMDSQSEQPHEQSAAAEHSVPGPIQQVQQTPSRAPLVMIPAAAPGPAPAPVSAVTKTNPGQALAAQGSTQFSAEELNMLKTVHPYSGVVVEAFTGGARPVFKATVQILGTAFTATTDDSGKFAFQDDLQAQGILPIVIMKDGYFKRRIDLRRNDGNLPTPQVELVSDNSVALSDIAVGEPSVPDTGFVFGELVENPSTATGSVAGLKVEVTGPTYIKPVYLDDNGIPNRLLPATMSRGQFMLVNVRPGTYLVNVTDGNGVEKAPHLIYVGNHEGIVRKFGLGEARTIHGHVFNAASVSAAVDGAAVQMLGNTQIAQTNKRGEFTLGPVNVDCYDTNYLQVDKSGFYRNRIDYACDDAGADHPVFVFSAAYTDSLSNETGTTLSPGTGVVIGHTSYRSSVKMQLWGPEELNPASETDRGVDYYMDNDGVLNSKLNRTTITGNFVILSAPDGLSYIQSFSKGNRTLSFWPIYISASTVNVYMQ